MGYIAYIAVFTAFLIKGITGFANTLVFGSIMSYTTNTINITPIDLLVGYPANIIIAYKERKSIDVKVFLPLAILVILGIIPGAIFLKNGDVSLIKIIFGVAVVAVGIEALLRERVKEKKKPSKLLLTTIGLVSGVLCGIFGIGAPLVAYLSRTTNNVSQFRGNITMVFLMENTFRLILYSISGIITLAVFKESLLLIPFMVLGLVLGIFLSKKLNEKAVKRFIVVVLIVSGVALIINNI